MKQIKLSPRAIAHLRVHKAMTASGSFGMGGLLKRDVKKAPITLRRSEYEKAKQG